ncbi:nitroreductase [Lysinibacillus boronitolerans]|uniref:Putative NAD(P)H nitroreductase n=1 Tax=Lysinibacillus boronitolerans JCM 21713 = 10a = NBRC 103108 TaxID=1294264 RepID=A0ABR4Y1G9_9BACI|nr:nitroreductase [Lysinibacillus boronitolerans]KGR86029.1 cobalamin biosynthesis protein CbiY [Lysinibacillus boronitolerans JCM 21713 = 10a = NBRC 103108]MCS1392396.1 nitroreductase [Lysinibacillus boronitolerans]
MTVIEALKKRRAIRNYTTQPVEKEKIEQILQAATYAPNDRMREPWHFYVIQDEAMKRYEEMASAYLQERFPTKPNLVESSLKVVQTTPVAIVVTADIVEGDADATEDNVFAVCSAIMSMWLTAEELGLGFVWRTRGVGLVHDSRMHTFIGASEAQKVVGTIFIGYPQEQEQAEKKRTPFAEKTTWL